MRGPGRSPLDDPRDATIGAARTARFFFHRQFLHGALATLLGVVAWALAAPSGFAQGEVLGIPCRTWFALSIAVPVVHQVLVAAVFRGQLGWAFLRRWLGRNDLVVWAVVFLPFLVARPLLVYAVARADAGSLALPAELAIGLGVVLAVPSLYAAYSVARWFGIARALGGDHFRVAYREMPLVRRGAFAWTSNAMYALVFLGLWSVALILQSHVALVAALFQHAYIQVHWHCTEKPDMDAMYGPASAA